MAANYDDASASSSSAVLKALAQKAVREQSLLRTIIDNIPDFIYAKDRDGRYLIDNDADMRLLRASSPEEVVGKTVFDFFPKEIAARFDEDDKTVIQTGTALTNREEPYEGPNGEVRWLSTTKVPLRDEQGLVIGLIGISRDITERKRAQEELSLINHELQRLVKQDPLTGILNRRSILETAEIEWLRFQRYGENLSVLMLDADNFKKINDTYGHLVGDEVLKYLTGKLKLSLRDVDFIGRYGGEEFLVVLPHTPAPGAKITADRVLQSLCSNLHTMGGGSLKVTMSIGGATGTKSDADVNALINRADANMYKAKQNGKNCYVADGN